MRPFAVALLLLFLLSPPAGATGQGVAAMQNWKTMDKCSQAAHAAFPDFTPDSNAKRDAKLKECLNASGLPPREPLSQPR